MADAPIQPGTPGPARRALLLWGGSVAAAVCLVVALPLWLDRRGLEDPAADAEAAYRELLIRIETRTAGAAPVPSEAALPELAVATPRRDLFAPVQNRRADVAAVQARRKRAKLPLLSGVLIDGPSRQAVLDGRVVGVGEHVGGYRVESIDSEAVIVGRAGSKHRVTIGASP